eukprot:261003_1
MRQNSTLIANKNNAEFESVEQFKHWFDESVLKLQDMKSKLLSISHLPHSSISAIQNPSSQRLNEWYHKSIQKLKAKITNDLHKRAQKATQIINHTVKSLLFDKD